MRQADITQEEYLFAEDILVKRCYTGFMIGEEIAFLIQNAFPIIEKYFDHVHTIQEKPVMVHKELNRMLTENLREVLAMHSQGIRLTFTDIDTIRTVMESELHRDN
jgi:hypothetical protein